MNYLGSKSKISKQLYEIMRPVIWKMSRGIYVEPFFGGGGMMVNVEAPVRIASDSNLALMNMWIALSKGWMPPESCSEEEYNKIKNKMDIKNPMTAFVGFGCSFNGKFFGGYARNSINYNYCLAAKISCIKKIQKLKNVNYYYGDYRNCPTPRGSVIYCDPPYDSTTNVYSDKEFISKDFWLWAEKKHKEGCAVFVSEYSSPENFKEIFSIELTTPTIKGNREKFVREEKLFVPINSNYFR